MGRGCSSVGRASDRHAVEAGSILDAARDFSPSQLSVQALLWYPYAPVCNRMHLYLCAR